MLVLKDVCKTFNKGSANEKVALRGVDLTVKEGEFITVIGGNGAGKSTSHGSPKTSRSKFQVHFP